MLIYVPSRVFRPATLYQAWGCDPPPAATSARRVNNAKERRIWKN
jgi:hypothetical protein